jgi:hypothetical protein
MQVTLELPDSLAQRVSAEKDTLAELLEWALRRKSAHISSLRGEVISFLGRGPQPSEIVAFRPSEKAVKRMTELLQRNREGTLSLADLAEMDEIEELDTLITFFADRRRAPTNNSRCATGNTRA